MKRFVWQENRWVFLLFFWLLGVSNSWLVNLLGKFRLTRRDGSQDVWTYALSSGEKKYEYVHVVDLQSKLIYAGWIRAFSESEGFRELLLEHVQVLDLDYNLNFELPAMYISRPKGEILLDFPLNPNEKENQK